MDLVQRNNKVLFIWSNGSSPESLQMCVEQLRTIVDSNGHVQPENLERLALSNHDESSFDIVLCGLSGFAYHNNEDLELLLKILKPEGSIILREATTQEPSSTNVRSPQKLKACLTLTGFNDVSEPKEISLCDEEKMQLINKFPNTNVKVMEVVGRKPNYEIGSMSQLKLSWLQETDDTKADVAAIWSLSASDVVDDDIELIDTNELLDEEDLVKPDPKSLRVCGTTGKRKACKNCSCGLAEELNGGPVATKDAKSACGSCYLGDAFRCASCPYLGMPAFKPGEKVQLNDRQLNADK